MTTADEWMEKRFTKWDFDLMKTVVDVEKGKHEPLYWHLNMTEAYEEGQKDSSLEITFLKVKLQELQDAFKSSQVSYSTQARNALTELEDGDEQECIDILKGISGDK